MKPEQVLKLEARLAAIEYMLAHLFKVDYAAAGATPEMIEQSHAQLRGYARQWSFPDLHDPAFSDLLAAEIEDALERLLQKIEKMALSAQKPPA